MSNQFDIKNVKIKEFDPMSSTKEDWRLYHEFRKIRHEEVNPDDPYTDNNEVDDRMWSVVAMPVRSQANIALRDFNEDIWHLASVDTAINVPDEAATTYYNDYVDQSASVKLRMRYNVANTYDINYELDGWFI